MRLRIKGSSFFEASWLEVDSSGVTCYRSAFVGGRQHFDFKQVDCILMSPDNTTLTLQSGKNVFSIRVKPSREQHQRTIDALVGAVRRTAMA